MGGMTTGELIDLNAARPQGHYAAGQLEDAEYVRRLKERMAPHARAILGYLLPGGRFQGPEFVCGNIRGDRGDSLKISLQSNKLGVGEDFATGERFGDLIDIWKAVRGLEFRAACDEIEQWLGRPFHAPAPAAETRTMTDDLGSPTAQYNYTDEAGRLIAVVYRYDPPGRRKEFRPWDVQRRKHTHPEPRPLYNRIGIATVAHVVLVEGEKAADALIARGICATTAMGGARAPIEKTDWTPLKGKHVTIWPDNDEPGLAYARNAAEGARTAGAASVTILTPPQGKAEGWDAYDAIAESMDVHAFIGTLKPKPDIFPTLDLVSLSTLPPPSFLIDELVPDYGLTVLYGPPESYKSFVALDLALSVVFGQAWNGRAVKQGAVLYIAGEGVRGIARRVAAWLRHHGLEDANAPFHLLGTSVNLLEPAQVLKLVRTLEELRRIAEHPFSMVVIDTVARAMPGADENAARDMGMFISATDRVRDVMECAVLGIHHAGKDNSKGARGSSALAGGADAVIRAERLDKIVTLTNEKQKDSDHFQPILLEAQSVDITDELPPRTSLVLVPAKNLTETAPRKAKLTDTEQAALIEINRLLDHPETERITVGDRHGRSVTAVSRDLVRTAWITYGVVDVGNQNALTESERQRVHRLLSSLKGKGKIDFTNKAVWTLST